MIAQTPCPCCGHIVEPDAELRWNEHSRTLSGCGHVAMLSPIHGKIFTKLWKAWPSGRMITLNEMMDHVYADHPDGGPESNNVISVQLNFMRHIIARFGISIRGRSGYLIS
jgi:hypothetical protein